jgi:hypothetical protein
MSRRPPHVSLPHTLEPAEGQIAHSYSKSLSRHELTVNAEAHHLHECE